MGFDLGHGQGEVVIDGGLRKNKARVTLGIERYGGKSLLAELTATSQRLY